MVWRTDAEGAQCLSTRTREKGTPTEVQRVRVRHKRQRPQCIFPLPPLKQLKYTGLVTTQPPNNTDRTKTLTPNKLARSGKNRKKIEQTNGRRTARNERRRKKRYVTRTETEKDTDDRGALSRDTQWDVKKGSHRIHDASKGFKDRVRGMGRRRSAEIRKVNARTEQIHNQAPRSEGGILRQKRREERKTHPIWGKLNTSTRSKRASPNSRKQKIWPGLDMGTRR